MNERRDEVDGRERPPPQKKVVATKKSGGHKKKWWPQKKVVAHFAKKNSVYESESRYFLVASLIYLTVGANT